MIQTGHFPLKNGTPFWKTGHFNNNGTTIFLKENRSFKSGLHSYSVYLIYHKLHQGSIVYSRTSDTSSWTWMVSHSVRMYGDIFWLWPHCVLSTIWYSIYQSKTSLVYDLWYKWSPCHKRDNETLSLFLLLEAIFPLLI